MPDVPYSVNANVTSNELNTLLKTLLEGSLDVISLSSQLEFDFLLLNEYLKGRLSDHLREKAISSEDNIVLEYVEKYPPPEPLDSLLHDDWVAAVQMCDKWILSGCYDNTVNIWNTKGEHYLTIPGHTMPVRAVAWISLDENRGKFISCSQDQTAILWDWVIDVNLVECISVYKGHERGIDSVAVSPKKDHFVTGSWDTMLKMWSINLDESEQSSQFEKKRSKIENSVVKVSFKNYKYLNENEEKLINLYQMVLLQTPIMTLQGHRECISAVQWIDFETILTSSWDHTMKIWDLNLEGIKSEISTNKSIFDASYSHLNRLIVTASADKNIRLYDNRTNREYF